MYLKLKRRYFQSLLPVVSQYNVATRTIASIERNLDRGQKRNNEQTIERLRESRFEVSTAIEVPCSDRGYEYFITFSPSQMERRVSR